MSIYDDLRGVAAGLFAEFDQGGVAYIGMQPGNGPAYNPGPPTEAAPIAIPATVRGVSFKFIDGTNVLRTDKQVSFAADGRFTPDGKGFVLNGSERLKVVEVKRYPEALATPAVSYTLILRK